MASPTSEATETSRPRSSRPSTISDHPSLKPALHLRVLIGPAMQVGSLSRGNPLTVVPLVGASLTSEPGFPIPIDAHMRGQGVDYVHNDPDGRRMRLSSDLVVGEGRDGLRETIHIHYTGIIDINNEMRRILGMSPNAASTDFGSSFLHVTFETGASRFKPLEEAIFVGAGRFILDGSGLSAEYRISQVCKGIGSGNTVADEGAAQSTGIPP
ncbi:hypothetical protein B0A52_05511 [Exophiala mesophila]|uniref:Uncharacterized protein n=1 Tax=Exophiala mesophila TaxID=212818 RepID=A0A438N3E1_EXOME|nr:hypothetical protein B0A52_05511 [Exophiala mesophila]